MTTTDTQLKSALAKMLPDKLGWLNTIGLIHIKKCGKDSLCQLWGELVKDTELLHLCWLVEEEFKEDTDLAEQYNIKLRLVVGNEMTLYYSEFYVLHATWQQRTIALCKVKGVEII